jgi:hypothetical protein
MKMIFSIKSLIWGICKVLRFDIFIHVIEKHLHKRAQIKYCEKRGCDSEITHADLSKKLLHYDPKINLERVFFGRFCLRDRRTAHPILLSHFHTFVHNSNHYEKKKEM